MNVLLYGAGEAGIQLLKAFKKLGYIECVGVIDDARIGFSESYGIPLIEKSEISVVLAEKDVEEIVVAIPSLDLEQRSEILNDLAKFDVKVRLLPDRESLGRDKVHFTDVKDVELNDVLGRFVVQPDAGLIKAIIKDKTIMITGAGGSIGSEICRVIAKYSPTRLILVDHSEPALFAISEELNNLDINLDFREYLASIASINEMELIYRTEAPEVVFHAAAYKHVSLVENNIAKGFQNNVLGTKICAELAQKYSVNTFVLVSSDKAVRPTNVMGATKRLAEQIVQGLNASEGKTKFCSVRFGNVLGSSGSVIPIFLEQIKRGGPITVRDRDVTRYFMSISEAAELVIQAAALCSGGEVFLLEMGEPVKIMDLAKRLISLSGLKVGKGGVEIVTTGLKPGEKKVEELLIGNESSETRHPKIFCATESFFPYADLVVLIQKTLSGDHKQILELLYNLVEGFEHSPN
jgi:UDP-N-acetylglucosamine 4,6-dehydratase